MRTRKSPPTGSAHADPFSAAPPSLAAADLKNPPKNRLLDKYDVAARLGICVRTLEKIVALGELKPLWIRRQRRWDPATVDAYIRSCTEKPRRPRRRGRS